jgi:serine/threonine-protein kinase RsbW
MEHYLCEAVIPPDIARTTHLVEAILNLAHEFDEKSIFGIQMSLVEALVNAIKHGNGEDLTKHVTLTCIVTDNAITIKIADEGPGFDPVTVPDCLVDENLDKPSGRGLELIRSLMESVQWNDKGNEIEMRQIKTAAA